jgi:hypothetical protein
MFFAKKELAKPACATAPVLGPEISTKHASVWLAIAALHAAGRGSTGKIFSMALNLLR